MFCTHSKLLPGVNMTRLWLTTLPHKQFCSHQTRGVREAINWDEEDLEVYTIRRQDPQAGKKELRSKKLLLPSSAFESYVEEPIGLLNKAAPISGPQPELDPDVVAGLDDNEFVDSEVIACHPDDEDALPDDFVLMLNAEKHIHSLDGCGGGDDGDEVGVEWEDYDDDDDDDNDSDREMPRLEDLSPFSMYRERSEKQKIEEGTEERDFSSDFNESEDEDDLASLGEGQGPLSMKAESHFTNYSMSSSVLPRNKGLSTLDDCFEEKFIREYQEEQVGALDGEEVEGWVEEESTVFKQAMDQSRRQMAAREGLETQDDRSRIIRWITDMQSQRNASDDEKEEIEVPEDSSEKWDCESILTTASTLYNHPRTITDPPRRKRIAVDPHTGIPLEHRVGGLTRRNLAYHDNTSSSVDPDRGIAVDTQTLITSMSAISVRPPGETSTERRYRKKALKELRRERRIEKKMNRSAFKEEKKRQEKTLQNNKHNCKMSLM